MDYMGGPIWVRLQGQIQNPLDSSKVQFPKESCRLAFSAKASTAGFVTVCPRFQACALELRHLERVYGPHALLGRL